MNLGKKLLIGIALVGAFASGVYMIISSTTGIESTDRNASSNLSKPEIMPTMEYNYKNGKQLYEGVVKTNNSNAGVVVYRSTTKNGTYKEVTKSTDNKFSIEICYGCTYYYKAKSYTGKGKNIKYSSYSNPVLVESKIDAPTIKKGSGNSLVFTDKNNGAVSGIEILYSTSQNGTYKLLKKTTIKNNGSVSISVDEGKTYYYKVRSYVTYDGQTSYSNYSNVVSLSKAVVVTTPKLSAKVVPLMRSHSKKFELSVDKLAKDETLIFYKWDDKANAYKEIDLKGSGNTRTVEVTLGEKHWYRVKIAKTVNGKKYYSAQSATVTCDNTIKAPNLKITYKSPISGMYVNFLYEVDSVLEGGYVEFLTSVNKEKGFWVFDTKSTKQAVNPVAPGTSCYGKARVCKKTENGKVVCSPYSSVVQCPKTSSR